VGNTQLMSKTGRASRLAQKVKRPEVPDATASKDWCRNQGTRREQILLDTADFVRDVRKITYVIGFSPASWHYLFLYLFLPSDPPTKTKRRSGFPERLL